MEINYNRKRNAVEIWGCSTCPFSVETPRAEGWCTLVHLSWITGLPHLFPEDCPLRDPNFELITHIQ